MALADEDYARLLAFRDGLRRFQRWSERQSAAVGLSAAQHQLLLAVAGHRAQTGAEPTIGDVAEHLLLRHHSAGELVERAVGAGLLVRLADPADRRVVRLRLTPGGRARLKRLTEAHLAEIRRLALWRGLDLPAS